MSETLAILGGKPAVTDRIQFRMWPEVTREDEEMILQSLRQGEHAFDPTSRCFRMNSRRGTETGSASRPIAGRRHCTFAWPPTESGPVMRRLQARSPFRVVLLVFSITMRFRFSWIVTGRRCIWIPRRSRRRSCRGRRGLWWSTISGSHAIWSHLGDRAEAWPVGHRGCVSIARCAL